METLTHLYPVEMTIAIILAFFVAYLRGFSVWRTRVKAQGNYSGEAELRLSVTIVISFVFVFLVIDVMMYYLGADISLGRLESVFSALFMAVSAGVYFGFIIPKVFHFEYARFLGVRNTLWDLLWGLLIISGAALAVSVSRDFAEFVFESYAPFVFNFY